MQVRENQQDVDNKRILHTHRLNYPVKRHKPNDDGTAGGGGCGSPKTLAYKNHRHEGSRQNLYASHDLRVARIASSQTALLRAVDSRADAYGNEPTATATAGSDGASSGSAVTSSSTAAAATAAMVNGIADANVAANGELLQDIKAEPTDGSADDEAAKAATGGDSLYTSKGLQPTDTDLDQLFDDDNLMGGISGVGSAGSPMLGVSLFPA